MNNRIAPLSQFIDEAGACISRCDYRSALIAIDRGFTCYPCSKELIALLDSLPPDHVEYSQSRDERARAAAIVYLSRLNSLVSSPIDSVIEFGSGQGSWISEAKKFFNIANSACLAIDGPWAQHWHDSSVPFIACDLNKSSVATVLKSDERVQARYELAICVEVCEHLSVEAAKSVVNSICDRASIVIFGSALTGQFGQGHRNCRSHYYWQAMFLSHGFKLFDAFRSHTFEASQDVPPWYAQNTYLYIRSDYIASMESTELAQVSSWNSSLDYPHPQVINPGMSFCLSDARLRSFPSLLWEVV
jgi:hypothetical protein